MDKKQKLQYQQEVEKYLEEKKVYDILEDLMKQLIVLQPDNPIDFMIKKLSDKEQKKIFIVGPPNSQIKEVALQLSLPLQFECISVGDLLKKEISKKSEIGQKIESQVKQFTYVEDKIVIDLVKKTVEEYDKEKKSYILEGFPKTRVQGLALQKSGVIPDTFIIYNQVEDKIQQQCLAKICNGDGIYNHLPKYKREILSQNHTIEYTLNIKQVKEIYDKNYFQIDADHVQQGVLEDIVKLVSFKIHNKSPKRAARIIVLGPPGSGRTTLAKKLTQKYGLVYVSTQELLNNEVARKTQVGQNILPLMQQGDQVMDDIVFSLLNDRINQTDCHLQGFVLDGFPKNSVQLMHLDELKISPSLFIILECSDEQVEGRLGSRKIDPITGIVYDKQNPCQDTSILRRLEKINTDTQDVLRLRLKRYKDLMRTLETTYQTYLPLILKVNADQSAQNILEEVSLHLEKKVRENIEVKNF